MSRDLVCTFCGSTLFVSMETRPGHGMYDEPGAIECDGDGCYACWKPDGTYLTGGDDE